eukprot:794118-Amphidinium_carterae.1
MEDSATANSLFDTCSTAVIFSGCKGQGSPCAYAFHPRSTAVQHAPCGIARREHALQCTCTDKKSSPEYATWGTAATQLWRKGRSKTSDVCTFCASTSMPVSYTHLRAHETEADL